MTTNDKRDESPVNECAELVELGDVSTQTRGSFLGFIPELSIAGWWF